MAACEFDCWSGRSRLVGAAVAGCSSAAPPPAAAPTPAPSGTPAEQGVRGQITAETATTWTVTTAKGKAFTVTLGPQTVFGTKTAPATAAQFPVGTAVRVTGPRNGATVTATRVALGKAKPAPTATPDRPEWTGGRRPHWGRRRPSGVPDPGRSALSARRRPRGSSDSRTPARDGRH